MYVLGVGRLHVDIFIPFRAIHAPPCIIVMQAQAKRIDIYRKKALKMGRVPQDASMELASRRVVCLINKDGQNTQAGRREGALKRARNLRGGSVRLSARWLLNNRCP